MKKPALLIVLVLNFQLSVLTQQCLPEGITFTTQEQIDSFQINYPNCNVILGDVTIGDVFSNNNINNLNGLNILTSIEGLLKILNPDSLTSLSGLDSLTVIGGNLEIVSANDLTSLSGLGNVTSIGGDLNIRLTHSLVSLSGINSLDSIGGSLWIYHNHDLTSLSGLNSLSSINGGLSVILNNYLQSLDGLDNIDPASIEDLLIHDNALLADCEVQSICDYLKSPNGVVNIYKNRYGCQSPAEIANSCGNTMPCLPFGNYYFFNQTEIDNFQTNYPGCTELMGNVTLEGNDITNLDSLIVLTSIEGSLNMSCINLMGFPCNPSLSSIAGLANLTSLGGNLYLQGNISLTNLEGFEGLDSIGGNLQIEWNPLLSTLEGLNNLTYINGGFGLGSAYPPNSNVLTSMAGLENLTYIGDGLLILGNPLLASLQGLDNVTSIGGDLSIECNDTLVSLSGLDNVTSIGGELQIRDNDDLLSLSGLDNIDANSINDLEITFNSALSNCEVESICDYLTSPNGSIIIYENATGCNSQEEVEEACESVYIVDNDKRNDFLIYPNPATKEISISTKNDKIINEVNIYSEFGQKVIHAKQFTSTIDVSTLRPGIYIIELVYNNQNIRMKFITN